MPVHRLVRLTATGLGFALIAVAVIAVTASATGLMATGGAAPAKPGARVSYCDAYAGHLAANLGKSGDQLKSAGSVAAVQTIDDAVKNGDMTPAQADAAKKKLVAGEVCPAGVGGIGREAQSGLDLGALYVRATAKALGISTDELTVDLKQKGLSVHQIADSKGVTQDQFNAGYAAAIKAEYDSAVQQGKLTQKQEDQLLTKPQADPIPWDKPAPRPKVSLKAG